jgi:putative tryptophan/tyrosine transport system substrate-binding protein
MVARRFFVMRAADAVLAGPALLREAAADKILKGASPAELPIQLPIKVTLVLNLKTAGELGVSMPSSLLARADQVIE